MSLQNRMPPNRAAMAVLLLLLVIAPVASSGEWQPAGLNLTWMRDPTTTMAIDWHTLEAGDPAALEYRRTGQSRWTRQAGSRHPFPFSERMINRAELTGLQPATEYEFRFGEGTRTYKFRTMPANNWEPVRFAAGGDVRGSRAYMEKTSAVAASYSPDFIVFGGDLAYANGDPRRVENWYDWFEVTRDTFVTPDGRNIPVVVAIGNHELWGWRRVSDEAERETLQRRWGLEEDQATFFFDLFPMPGKPGYNVLDFGDYLSLILLDSDHANSVGGAQAEWLERTLQARSHVPHIIPVYHQPGYPAVRSYGGSTSRRVREIWVPLFERHGVRVAFENHDHVYKRTYPLIGSERAANGIVFLGDGAWGVGTREIGRDQGGQAAPYLAEHASSRHFILGTLHGPHQHFVAIDEDGAQIDEYPARPEKIPGKK